MKTKNEVILEEYRNTKEEYIRLGDIVASKLKDAVHNAGIEVLAIEHRIKEEKSLEGKLELKGEKYASLKDVTDILGARIICYFSDEVDKVAALIKEMFDVDFDKSVDTRAQLNPDSFGYLSLHYICSLKESDGYDEKLCGYKFEIQIRSILQHTWASINHDLGYKSSFGVPRKITREFSRIAGLLEIADDQFVAIRDSLERYGDEIREKIADNTADDVLIDLVSLNEYVLHNKEMRTFLDSIAEYKNTTLNEISAENYLEQLAWLGKKTIGDLQNMLSENRELALRLAKKSLENANIRFMSTNIGLRYLCRAELLNKGYSLDEMTQFFTITSRNESGAQRQAEHLVNMNFSI